jgi:hypothetical protein
VPATPAEVFSTVHALALRGTLKQLPGDARALEAAGLVHATPHGFTLTDAGYRRHRALLDRERATIDVAALGIVYERFPAIARRFKSIESRWDEIDGAADRHLVEGLASSVVALEPILHQSAEVVPRFGSYLERLARARRRLLNGKLEYGLDASVESIGTLVRELQEDYLQTLGQSYDEFDS